MTAYRKATRTLAVALVAAAVLFLTTTSVQADPPAVVQSQTVQQEIGFAYCQFVQCANNGAGEWISFKGTNKWISTIERTADNRVIVTWKLAEIKGTGTGIETGEVFEANKETTELVAVSFFTTSEANEQMTANVNWRGNISMDDGGLDFPLVFNGDISLLPDAKELKFRFREIETRCVPAVTDLRK